MCKIFYLGKTFLTCLSHFSQKNIDESGMTAFEHTGSVPKVFLVHNSLDDTKNNKDIILPTKYQYLLILNGT